MSMWGGEGPWDRDLWAGEDDPMFVSRGRSSRHRVSSSASTKLQRVVLVAVATFLSLAGLAGACVFLILRFRGLIKYWFHSPPGIPAQIEEVRARTPWEA